MRGLVILQKLISNVDLDSLLVLIERCCLINLDSMRIDCGCIYYMG